MKWHGYHSAARNYLIFTWLCFDFKRKHFKTFQLFCLWFLLMTFTQWKPLMSRKSDTFSSFALWYENIKLPFQSMWGYSAGYLKNEMILFCSEIVKQFSVFGNLWPLLFTCDAFSHSTFQTSPNPRKFYLS